MRPLARCFRAELIKWRKGWALLTILLAPLCQTGFLFMILWFSFDLVQRFKPGFAFWIELNYLVWNVVFMPIVCALVSDLSWELETESKAWNHLLLQPLPHRAHYQNKLLSHLALVFISQALLALLLVPVGLMLRAHLGWVMGPVPIHLLIQFASFSLLASVPMVAFHTWFSARFPGIGAALVTAVSGTWLCVHFSSNTALLQFIPWGMTSQIVAFFDRWHRHIPWELAPGCLLSAGTLAALGTRDFARNRAPRH